MCCLKSPLTVTWLCESVRESVAIKIKSWIYCLTKLFFSSFLYFFFVDVSLICDDNAVRWSFLIFFVRKVQIYIFSSLFAHFAIFFSGNVAKNTNFFSCARCLMTFDTFNKAETWNDRWRVLCANEYSKKSTTTDDFVMSWWKFLLNLREKNFWQMFFYLKFLSTVREPSKKLFW